MPSRGAPLDSVFRALADPTRRAVLEQLSNGPAPVSALAEPYDMALPSFLQHLKVLEDCGLVRTEKAGRVRTCQLVPLPLKKAESWMADRRAAWASRLDQLDDYLRGLHNKEKSR